AMAITPEIKKLQKLVSAFEAQESGANDESFHAITDGEDYHTVQDRFIELGGYQLEPKAKQILHGLSFREKDFHRPAREMSGGWVMRAHLAKLLVQEPDLLILDEPTNHLDLESLQWFQEYLKSYPGGILMISHDREFLNQLVSHIVEIRSGKFIRYRGTYEDYLAQRAANEVQLLAAYKNQQKEIAHLQEFADRFRAKASKASQAQSKLKQIERMDKIEAPTNDEKKIKFSFPQPQRSGLKVITLKDVDFAYDKNIIYRKMEFQAERDQRTVLVGPNGAGKSTLLKILAGVLKIQGGTRELGHNAKEGYFSQYRVENLNVKNTVFEEAMDTPQRVTEQFIRTVLGSFLFRGDDVFKKVSVLSGGEKSRLALVKLLLDPPNLLLMDEPTTHLDMASIDALIGALKQFQGTLIFISHDVYFIRQISNHVVHVNAGQLTHYSGDYQYYLDKTAAISAQAALTSTNRKEIPKPISTDKQSAKSKDQKRSDAELRQSRSREQKEQQKIVHALEKEISELEKRRGELTVELEKPETYSVPGRAQEVNRELSGSEESLHSLGQKWEIASMKLAELESAF
ncbi:MAG: ABC-F family ATP-binding cassette domain-containing protein, partial [Verrucomicrobiota bacterium]|nr:ABC-F family ATP-binding cassette domain-containing protein [Verrucomicrobiota bacterium]